MGTGFIILYTEFIGLPAEEASLNIKYILQSMHTLINQNIFCQSCLFILIYHNVVSKQVMSLASKSYFNRNTAASTFLVYSFS